MCTDYLYDRFQSWACWTICKCRKCILQQRRSWGWELSHCISLDLSIIVFFSSNSYQFFVHDSVKHWRSCIQFVKLKGLVSPSTPSTPSSSSSSSSSSSPAAGLAHLTRLLFKAFADAKDRWKIDGATMKAGSGDSKIGHINLYRAFRCIQMYICVYCIYVYVYI